MSALILHIKAPPLGYIYTENGTGFSRHDQIRFGTRFDSVSKIADFSRRVGLNLSHVRAVDADTGEVIYENLPAEVRRLEAPPALSLVRESGISLAVLEKLLPFEIELHRLAVKDRDAVAMLARRAGFNVHVGGRHVALLVDGGVRVAMVTGTVNDFN